MLSTSVTDNVPPKHSASPSTSPPPPPPPPPSGRQKAISRGVKEDTNSRQELAQKESELCRKRDAIKQEGTLRTDQMADIEQKVRELEVSLKRERENHDLKLVDLKAETYKSKTTLKEMGEIMKRETANLERIFRKKHLETNKESARLHLLHIRQAESLNLRHMSLLDEVESLNCEKYGVSKEALPQELRHQFHLDRERIQKDLQGMREHLRMWEERELSTNHALKEMQKEIEGHGKGIAIINTSTIQFDPNPNPNLCFLNVE